MFSGVAEMIQIFGYQKGGKYFCSGVLEEPLPSKMNGKHKFSMDIFFLSCFFCKKQTKKPSFSLKSILKKENSVKSDFACSL